MEYFYDKQKIKIYFNSIIIRSRHSGPKLLSEIEGHLLIEINDDVFFNESGILLLELAKELTDWISAGSGDFIYYSMDYEDGPILSFQENQSGWRLSSVWCDTYYENMSYINFVKQAECFISTLFSELKNNNIHFSRDGIVLYDAD